MPEFHEVLVAHRKKFNIDRDLLGKKAHINFQTIKFIESGNFYNVRATDLLSYLRVSGFKISEGNPRMSSK